MDEYYEAVSRLGAGLDRILGRLEPACAPRVQEVRLRSGRPIALSLGGKSYIYLRDGRLGGSEPEGVPLSQAEMDECFLSLCGHSVYAHEYDLKQGFFTLPGGHRVGLAGLPQWRDGRITGYRSVTGLNLRIARRRDGALPESLRSLLAGQPLDLLLVGPPGSGKTTLLRGAAAFLSSLGRRTVVIDERGELFPITAAGPQRPQPLHCDVLADMPKPEGILHALRCLGPQVILCDELASERDVQAVQKGRSGGVGFVATLHGYDAKDLEAFYRRCPGFPPFAAAAYLWGTDKPGVIRRLEVSP